MTSRDAANSQFSPANIWFHIRFTARHIGPNSAIFWKRWKTKVSYKVSRWLDPRRTTVPKALLETLQAGTLRYTYRGLRCAKNPFDLSLYLKLLHDLKPRTIIEIGSADGGSAKFFADQTNLLGLGTKVFSLDINPLLGLNEKNLMFIKGDVHNLAQSDLPNILEKAKHPILVVEDGPHTYEGCRAALDFFDNFLVPGDFMVVEDGNLRELGYLSLANGPNRAVKEFLDRKEGAYELAKDYCDFFGRNVTWNTDGYLRRIT